MGSDFAIVPTRNLNLLYILLDCAFLLVLLGLLLWKKRYSTVLFALFGGILYTVVDFGGFYLLSHSRTVLINGVVQDAAGTFWVLLWMSMSYGFTNNGRLPWLDGRCPRRQLSASDRSPLAEGSR